MLTCNMYYITQYNVLVYYIICILYITCITYYVYYKVVVYYNIYYITVRNYCIRHLNPAWGRLFGSGCS